MSHSLCLETDGKQETTSPHENRAGRFTEPLKSRFLAEHLLEVKDGQKTSPSLSPQEEALRKEES